MCAAGIVGIMNDDYSRQARVLHRHVAPVIDLPPANCAAPIVSLELAA